MATDLPPTLASFAQERFWFLDGLVAGNAAHTTQQLYRLSGSVDPECLAAAVEAIVTRHDVLRSRYVPHGDELRIGFTGADSAALRFIDLTGEPDPERRARALGIEDAFEPFDLAAGALFRTRLARISHEDYLLTVTAHRSVFDDASFLVVERELATEYGRALGDHARPLEPLPLTYAEHASAQRVEDSDLPYWREVLAGAPPAVDLPVDRVRPPVPSYQAEELEFAVPEHTAAALARLVTPTASVALAALAALLGRYARADEVVIGVRSEGRSRPGTAQLAGAFVGHLPVRLHLTGGETTGEMATRVDRTLREARAHGEVPFDRIASRLETDRDLSRHPVFQVIYGHGPAPEAPTLPGLSVRRQRPEVLWSRVDMELHLVETSAGGLSGRVSYAKDIFEHATVQRLVEHYLAMLDAFAAEVTVVSEVDILTAAERRLLADSHTVDEAMLSERTFVDLFEDQVRRSPDEVAVTFGECGLSYAELNSRANRLAGYLVDNGVGPEVTVGLCLRRGLTLMTAVLAVLKAGGAYLPMDPDNPPARNEFLLADSGAGLVLTQSDLRADLPAAPGVRYVDVAAIAHETTGRPDADLGRRAGADNMIYIIYTSGSTGRPKGVVMTHRPLVNLIQWQLRRTSVTGPTLQFSSIGFDISFEEMFATWLAGGRLVLISEQDRRDPERILAVLRAGGVRRLYCPPMVLEAIAQVDTEDLPPLAEIITAGEALHLTPEVRRLLGRLGDVAVDNQYGPTEAHVITGHRMTGAVADWPTHPPVGTAVTNTRVYVLDEHLRPVPLGASGEVYVGGVCLARGYLGRPELTAERFRADPFATGPDARMYQTGDLARRLPDGTLLFQGRVDEQVKIRGYRVEPGEIEAVLAGHPAVRDSAVLPVSRSGDRRLAAYVVLAPGAAATPAQLRAFLKESLPEYMVPTYLIEVNQIPLTAVGKIDQGKLPDPAGPDNEDDTERPEASGLEAALAAIWRDVIGIDRVGPDDNFFEIGGHSLLAVRVVGRIRQDLAVDLPIRLLFEHATVARLATVIAARSLETTGPAAAPVHGGRSDRSIAPLSPVQHGMWLLHQIHPDCTAYHMPMAFELVGQLDADALDQALGLLVARHETLRTGISTIDGHPVQRVSAPIGAAFAAVDLRHVPADQRTAVLWNRMAEVVGKPFDLASPGLWSAVRYRLDDDRHVLLLVVHHIVTDGWSMEVLKRELSTAYAAATAGRAPEWAELGTRFTDIADWEAGPGGRARIAEEVGFWRERLDPDSAALELPGHQRTTAPGFAGDRVRGVLDADTVGAVSEIAASVSASTFSVLLSAFVVVLARYSGRTDLQVGTPLTVRDHEGSEDLVGLFTNTMVLRCDADGGTFTDLVRRTHERVVEALSHPHVPFEVLVSELAPGRDGQRTPLFDVWFNLLNFDRTALELPGMRSHEVPTPLAGALFDLGVYLHETGGEVRIELVYRTAVFPVERVTALLEHFLDVIRQVCAAPDGLISAVRLPNARLARADFASAPPATITDRFRAGAAAHPDRVAVDSVSYADLLRRVQRTARSMAALGAGPGRAVALAGTRTPELAVGVLAARMAGAAFCVLDLGHPDKRLCDQLAELRPAVVDGTLRPAVLAAARALGAAALDSGTVAAPGTSTGSLPTAAAYVMFTSGTTGRPLGVVGGEAPLTTFFDWYAEEFSLATDDRFAVLAGLGHDPLLRELLLPLWLGATACLPDTTALSTPESTVRWLAREECTVVQLTPPRARLLAAAGRAAGLAVPSVRLVALGGAAVSASDHDVVRALFPRARVVSLYGTTETPQGVSVVDLAGESGDRGVRPPLGAGSPSAELLVLAPDERVTAVNQVGEVGVRSPHLALGYLSQPELTAARFRPDPDGQAGVGLYLTGDRGRYRPDGTVEFLGRADTQLTVEGTRVEPAEVERAAREHFGVADCVAFSRDGRLTLVASPAAPVDSLHAHLRAQLPTAMVPDLVLRVDRIPLTPNGKVDLTQLPDERQATPDEPVLETVSATWREVLGVAEVDQDATFFAVGGTSLGLLRVHNALRELVDENLTLAELFQYQTIRKLAGRLAAGADEPAQVSTPRGRRTHVLERAQVARLSARYTARRAAAQR